MGTTIRPELSEKNPYWLERHRYYELKHFCLQYPGWKKAYAALSGPGISKPDLTTLVVESSIGDPTANRAIAKAFYSERTDMVQRIASSTDPVLGRYILKAVTEGWSYDVLNARFGVPCCKDTYYNLYRKFFWLLSKTRG